MHYLNTTKFMKVNNNTQKGMVRAVQFFASWCGESVCVDNISSRRANACIT